MKTSAIHRTSREPIDRRQVRLIHALLAFPIAGFIGFTGNAVVESALAEPPTIAAPASPERTTDEHTLPREHDAPDRNDRGSEPTAL